MSQVSTLRDLPPVDMLMRDLGPTGLPRLIVVEMARSAIGLARARIEEGAPADPWAIAEDLMTAANLTRVSRVLNATGVLLHTNLGRAPLSDAAISAIAAAGTGYANLELDLATGARGGRGEYTRRLLTSLTGAEDAIVVNNNASAVLLCLAATATGLSVPVARGELIEIGGSYRLPDVMTASGAKLVEVGTTNRTRTADFSTAVQLHSVGAILKVHPSNYRVEGFTEEAPLEELSQVARTAGVPLIHDIGSGLLDHGAPWITPTDATWLASEPDVRQSLAHGADLVTFSGDKLLGGPQAGIVVGSAPEIQRLRDHPLARALRVDGITDVALAATLSAYAEDSVDDIPFWRMVHRGLDGLHSRLVALQKAVGGEIEEGYSLVGAGSVPGTRIPSPQLKLSGAGDAHERLLKAAIPVVTRRHEGDLIIDVRAVEDADDLTLTEMVAGCL